MLASAASAGRPAQPPARSAAVRPARCDPGGRGARISGSANGRGSGRAARATGSAVRTRDGRLGRRGPGIVIERLRAVCLGTRSFGARHRNVARRIDRHGAHDVLLDHEIARAADQQQMFDIVAPHQHEAAASVDRRGVDHGKAR